MTPELSAVDKIDALRWGWKSLLPAAGWKKCRPLVDVDGSTLVGVWYRTSRSVTR